MADEKTNDISLGNETTKEESPEETPKKNKVKKKPKPGLKLKPPAWRDFLETATDQQIMDRYETEVKEIVKNYKDRLSDYCFLALMDNETKISTYDLDQLFIALENLNADREKDVLLVLLSLGGNIEQAYQISKICKAHSKDRFVVAVPRQAKSAATLVAIGADEIHMGPLGQLGPIDPQLGGLPALGVTQALETIAALSERFPASADMFARYLRLALTVEQIGYCERVCESAEQYAERLLSTKKSLSKRLQEVARVLVHEYKDHGFVIDLDEARKHLGSDWILSDTQEILFAEEVYNLFDKVNLYLNILKRKRLFVCGELSSGVMVFHRRN